MCLPYRIRLIRLLKLKYLPILLGWLKMYMVEATCFKLSS